MKLRKDGKPARLHRDAWDVLQAQHEHFAGALTWLASRSFSSLLDEEMKDEEPKSETELRLRILRGREEGRMEGAHARKQLSAEAREIHCLLRTLMKWSVEQREEAELCGRIAAEDARGRPRTAPVSNALVAVAYGLPTKAKAKRPGRRKLVNLEDAAIISALDEGRSSGQKSDIAVLRKLARRYLATRGKHTAGEQVEVMAKNLQKRVAGLRKSFPK